MNKIKDVTLMIKKIEKVCDKIQNKVDQEKSKNLELNDKFYKVKIDYKVYLMLF